MRDLIDSAFRNFGLSELDEAFGLTDPHDEYLREIKGRRINEHPICSISRLDD
ncbi:hypothetical protein [Rhizobium leguminosarum]